MLRDVQILEDGVDVRAYYGEFVVTDRGRPLSLAPPRYFSVTLPIMEFGSPS